LEDAFRAKYPQGSAGLQWLSAEFHEYTAANNALCKAKLEASVFSVGFVGEQCTPPVARVAAAAGLPEVSIFGGCYVCGEPGHGRGDCPRRSIDNSSPFGSVATVSGVAKVKKGKKL
jgi:hypothetical protein